jgi:hypothetical protein
VPVSPRSTSWLATATCRRRPVSPRRGVEFGEPLLDGRGPFGAQHFDAT